MKAFMETDISYFQVSLKYNVIHEVFPFQYQFEYCFKFSKIR